MILTITFDNSDEIALQRLLEDHELLDCDLYAKQFANDHLDADLSLDGIVPLGCGQFSVEIAEHPKTFVCWQARSYFTK